MKPENKSRIHIQIFGSQSEHLRKDWQGMVSYLNVNGISASVPTDQNAYDIRMSFCFNSGYKYSVKIDEDIFVNNFILDYLVENINCLDNDNNTFMAILLSTGIPTVEPFINGFFNQQEKEQLHNSFKQYRFEHTWGVYYHELNRFTINASKWVPDDYFDYMKNNFHSHYKGIHPIRLHAPSTLLMNELVLRNKQKLVEKQNYMLYSTQQYPYLCNSFFAMRTERWKEAFDTSDFHDGFDEVAINKYRIRTGGHMIIIDKSFAVHPSYNSIGNLYKDISDAFFNEISQIA
jgi:hypothetical protein